MFQKFKILLFIILFASLNPLYAAYDSLGIKTVDGIKYIMHKVEARETLFSIAKRYNVTVSDITKVNEAEKDGLKIDQIDRILLIPFSSNNNTSSSLQTRPGKSHPNKHIVMAGETLYSLSKKFNVNTKDLQKWNNMEGTNLSVGEEIWIAKPDDNSTKKPVASITKTENKPSGDGATKELEHTVDFGETIYSISKAYGVSQEDIMVWNRLKDTNISVGQTLTIKSNKGPTENKKAELKSDQPAKGMYTIDVQTFHNAQKGEDYKSVANEYSLKVADLKKWNNFKEPFQGGEVIKIVGPKMNKEKNRTASIDTNRSNENEQNIHVVKSGETIYSLSDTYEVEMEDLRKWNNLSNYQLSVGQKLYISNPDGTDVEKGAGSAEKIELEVSEEKEPKSVLAENPQKQDTKAYFTVEEEDIPKIDKISEKGVAEVIAGSESTEKYLALHRTAKIGTIIQVRNDLNDQIVFVRVLGKMPNNGVDDKVIIRISKKAFEKLGGVDYKFPVEISYLPLKGLMPNPDFHSLKAFLDEKYLLYNRPEFIDLDPVSIPHLFSKKQDIEIAGFWAAVLAWGQRVTIINKCKELFEMMDNAPHDFILNHTENDLKPFLNFKHRTFNATDTLYFINFFKEYYQVNKSLENAFLHVSPTSDQYIKDSLTAFHQLFFDSVTAPSRTKKHIATPARKSACKRLNMFLRWMVRKDEKGVDFGIWHQINPAQLICPCDLHVDRVARKLGLIQRKQTDWQTAEELTAGLRKMDPKDPVKYDFALFGLGVIEGYAR